MAGTITDLIKADHDATCSKFEDLEELSEIFKRGVTVFACRLDKESVIIKKGVINSATYFQRELSLNVRKNELDGHTDFVVTTKLWKFFQTFDDLNTYLSEILADKNYD